jgi:hypothetical protein
MWLNVKWFDAGSVLVGEDGAYGNIGRTVQDNAGVTHQVQSLLNLDDTVVYEAKPGLDEGWADQLLALGYSPSLALEYDRLTDQVAMTLGELAGEPAGSMEHTFHFALNNVMTADNRIPPYGFSYDEARRRNALPVPATQFGSPGPGGTFQYWDAQSFEIPSGAVRAEVRLLYQQTSWEYVHFLWKANDGLNTFLGAEGRNLLDAWLNTGQAAPVEIALATANVTAPLAVPGQASDPIVGADQLRASWNKATSRVDITYTPACDATDHVVHWGDLANVSTYSWSGAACALGSSGTASFSPGPGNVFFVIVADNGSQEGSYGLRSTGAQRPEHVGTVGCDRPQNLGGVTCE